MSALEGIRVLDFTRVLSGPYGTMALADLGADVVKVEPPGGDDTRSFGPPFVGGTSTYFLSINRGKRSIEVDLRDPEQRARVRELALAADVVVENFRQGVMERFGLGAQELLAEKPGLVYCSITGFGIGNPGGGYDLLVQGLSGVPSITGDGEQPWKCGASIADLVAGMNATQGILAALVKRERTGEGGLVEVSMMRGELSLLTYHASAWLNAGQQPRALGNSHPSIHPFQPYRVADGWLNLAVGNDSLFRRLCEALDVSWHKDDRFTTNPQRVRHRKALDELLAPVLAGREMHHWMRLLSEAGVPAGPMATVAEALEGAEVLRHSLPEGEGEALSLPGGFRLVGDELASARRAPRLGEHEEEVFKDWLRGP